MGIGGPGDISSYFAVDAGRLGPEREHAYKFDSPK